MTRAEAIDIIGQARINRGLSKTRAAGLAGLSPSVWHMAECRKRKASVRVILLMAQAVGLEMEYQPESFAVDQVVTNRAKRDPHTKYVLPADGKK